MVTGSGNVSYPNTQCSQESLQISFTQCSPNSPPVTEICDNFQISSARLFEAEKNCYENFEKFLRGNLW